MTGKTTHKQSRLSNQVTYFLLTILLINTFVAVTIAGSHFMREYISLVQSRAETVGSNLKSFMQEILSLGLEIGALEGIEKELEKTVRGDLKALYANVVDKNCLVIYSFPKRTVDDPFYQDELSPLMLSNQQKTFTTRSAYNIFIPINAPDSTKVVGGINIGVSKKYVYSKTIDSAGTLVFIFCTFILLTLVLFSWFVRRSIKPLEVLHNGALSLGKGDLAVRVDIDADNEIGSLAQSFNDMAQRLQTDHAKLKAYTIELEQRNKKLKQAHSHILQREEKLKKAQSQLVLSEKMASLGLLIAGVAHEINTPVGAISNVASDMRGRIETITDHLMQVRTLSPEQLRLMGSLSLEFGNAEFSTEKGMQWKKNRALREWLTKIGVQKANDVVAILSKYNMLEKKRLIKYKDLLKEPYAIKLMDSFGTLNVGMKICESSTKKISEIVKALKYYAYTDMDKTSLVDINENIENVLLLMHNKLKYHITVEKNLSPLPQIRCTSDISQAWTNLISNAHDAIMASQKNGENGHINIQTQATNGQIIARITDNGMGIPPEIITKIFDPFFTTKGIGRGTGLGLGIVSGIVKKHGGDVAVESKPGNTCFTVTLPMQN